MALEISDNGINDFIIGTIYYPDLNLSVTAPDWVTTGMTSSPAYSSITISVGENENDNGRSGTTKINFNGCGCESEKEFEIHQIGTTKHTMGLKIKNNSIYTTDFSNIVITVGSNPVMETINVLGNISGLPGYGTVSDSMPYKQSTEGNTIHCKARVTNNLHPDGEDKELVCSQGYCDPGAGDEVTFEYNE
jgi:hypothetical protein